jgi:hypothetical protein
MRTGGLLLSETRRLLLEYEIEEVGMQARKDKRVRQALEKAFTDTSDVVRARALIAAMDLNDPSIVDSAKEAINDEESEVRIAAAQLLAWYKQPRSIPSLLEGLQDSNPWVRSHSAAGLSKLLHGPIWARIQREKISIMANGFEGMTEEEIRTFLIENKLTSISIDRYINWKDRNFDIDYDYSVVEEMDSGSVILEEKEDEYKEKLEKDRKKEESKIVRSAEVEAILDELPDDVLESLPPEDLKRLTPETARELVDSLLESFDKEKKEKKKKKVKVRKVTRVKKVKKKSREDLIEKIPDEVKESLPEGSLDTLSEEDLEALIATTSDEEEPEADEFKSMTKSEIIEEIPLHVKEEYSDSKLQSMKKAELVDILEESTSEEEPLDPEKKERMKQLTEKYGPSKAKIMISIPADMLDTIPEEQLKEMDDETLKGLAQALEHE